nr:unnamed protein product [Digitaria exilis]
MNAPGSGTLAPASRKRPRIPGSASSSAGSCAGGECVVEAASGGSGSPRAKRRVFAAGGGDVLPACPDRRATAEQW